MHGPPTSLQISLANQILTQARLSGWSIGHHLTEDSLQLMLGTSRTPIRAAMSHLETIGVLEKRPNRGFFLKKLPPSDLDNETVETAQEDERIYFAIAMDRLSNDLPESVSENELIRRYDISRARLRHVLARIATEGWIERRQSRGWAFQPLIDSLEAYHENYRFRQIMEPAAIRSAEFEVDSQKVESLRAQQEFVRDRGYRTLSQVELFEIHSNFHETLATMSHNRFFVQTLARLNQLRRLMEYGRPLDRQRVRRVCDEHLGILKPLTKGDKEKAARRLEQHLSFAAIEKTGGSFHSSHLTRANGAD
jgi:DNA-binding GntR family transcriptional regulator